MQTEVRAPGAHLAVLDVGKETDAARERRRRRGWRGSRRGAAVAADLPAEASPIWEVIPGVDGVFPAPGAQASLRRDALFRRALAASDVVAAYLALLIAIHVIVHRVELRWTDVLLGPGVIVLCKVIGLYDRDQHRMRKATIDEVPAIVNLAIFYTLGLWLAGALLFRGTFDRPQVFVLVLVMFLLAVTGRLLTRACAMRLTSAERIFVIGDRVDCDRAINALSGAAAGTNTEVIGHLVLGPQGASQLTSRRRDLSELRELIQGIITRDRVERVVFAPDGCDQDEVLDLIRLIKALGVKLSVLPRLLEVVGSASVFDDLDGLSLLGVRPYGLTKSSDLLKRAMDVVGSIVLLAALSPLLLVIGLAIRLDSAGPVFFSQPRIGRRGRHFRMVKFRSMVANAEALKDELRDHNEAVGGLFKMSDDPRITRVGRVLRRMSLDELPQLLNVLRGEMSLVGPRPLVPDEDALIDGWKRRRLAVKPGMTGMWQIFGSARIPLAEMVKLDYMYGANWSLWLDLKILLRTLPYVVARRGQ